MNKLILLFKLIIKTKFSFNSPKENHLVIFDNVSENEIKKLIVNYKGFVLRVRSEHVNLIYLSPKILFRMFINIFKGDLWTVYLVSLIEIIKPKIVVTFIDNSFKFYNVAKILEDKAKFIAIQNAARYDLKETSTLYNSKKIPNDINKKIYIPEFLCFGDYEKDLYQEVGGIVKKFSPVGSVRLANFLSYIKDKKGNPEKYKSDICLISTTATGADKIFGDNSIESGIGNVSKYTVKFCKKNNKKLILALKRDSKINPMGHKTEMDFLKKHLNEDFEFAKKHILYRDAKDYSSYQAMFNSKVTVSAHSTIVREKMCLGGKVLSCNFTNSSMYDFPINGICFLKKCTFEEFESRLLEILRISNEDYFSKINNKSSYVMAFNKNISTIDIIKEKFESLGLVQKNN